MGHGVRAVVGKGEESFSNSEGFRNVLRLAVEGERRFSQSIVSNLNVRPLDSISKAPSDGLQKGLFGRKTRRVAFGRSRSFLTPHDFFLGEDPAEKMVPPSVHHPFDPIHIDDVNAASQDHSHVRSSEFGVRRITTHSSERLKDEDDRIRSIPSIMLNNPEPKDKGRNAPNAERITPNYFSSAIISRTARSSPT
nr:hypothetical protein [Deltaproteobacteria bacterium]